MVLAYGEYVPESESVRVWWTDNDVEGIYNLYVISDTGSSVIEYIDDLNEYSYKIPVTGGDYRFIVEKVVATGNVFSNMVVMSWNGSEYESVPVDSDNDGLLDIDEMPLGTNVYSADTDGDGLSDGEEINKYGTNPLLVDTDDDDLTDYEEIMLGLDPLRADTDGDGIIDSKEKIQQVYSHNVTNDCGIDNVSVSFAATGYVQHTTSIESMMNSDIMSSSIVGLFGEPFDINSTSKFDKAELTFKVDKSKLGDTEFDNLVFMWYDVDNYQYVMLDTIHDAANSTVSTTLTHFSRYMIIDKTKWFEAWNVDLYEGQEIARAVDTVLVIDCSGSMSSYDPRNVRRTASLNYIEAMGNTERVGVVTFASSATVKSALTTNKTTLKNALSVYASGGTNFHYGLNSALNLFDSSDNYKQIIFMTDGYDGSGTANVNASINSAIAKGVVVNTVGLGNSADALLKSMATRTGGEFYKAYTANDLIGLYEEMGYANYFDMTDNDGDDMPDAVEAAGIRLQNGTIIYTDPTLSDTDGDELLDGAEINPVPKRPLFAELTGKPYYFEMYSDPNLVDSDWDGIDDKDDESLLDNRFSGNLTSNDFTYDVEFNMDYRNFFTENNDYNKDLSILGSIYATLCYNDTNLEITSGTNFAGAVKDLYKTFGLTDVKNYKLVDSYDDDDISEMTLGHKKISYNGEDKDVIIVSVRGTDATIEEWSSNFDVGADTDDYWDRENSDWGEKENHKGFDVAANRLYGNITSYVKSYVNSNSSKTIYIVGHSRGAAIANILGSKFEDLSDYESFAYTFATPNTTTKENYASYQTIFNIVNEDDLVPILPLEKWGFKKFGTTYSVSIKDYYEHIGLGSGKVGTWEWMFDTDYNYNGNLSSTLSAFESIASNREDLYKYSDDENTIYTYSNSYYNDEQPVIQSRISKYGERIARHCDVYAVSKGVFPVNGTIQGEVEVFDIKVKQTPAFFMMVMADVVAKKTHTKPDPNAEVDKNQMYDYQMRGTGEDGLPFGIADLGFYVAKKYSEAKTNFCLSGADSVDAAAFFRFGGMVHAHMPGTYYFLSNDYYNALNNN